MVFIDFLLGARWSPYFCFIFVGVIIGVEDVGS